MRSIVVATDESGPAGHAVDFATDIASKFAVELVLTHVISPSALAVAGRGPAHLLSAPVRVEQAPIPEVLTDRATALLAQARRRAEERGARRVSSELRAGDPAEAILAVAAEHDADVIVLGKRGQGRLAGLLLGSISQKVVTLARCTVIVVP